MPLILVTPPAVEPISLFDLKTQIGMSPVEDADHVKSDQMRVSLRRHIRAARAHCENLTRRAFISQTWLWQLDRWPHLDRRYEHNHRDRSSRLRVPLPPLIAIDSFTYVDMTGVMQMLPAQTDFGVTPVAGTFAYQLDAGSETQPARLSPAWLGYWPPIRNVQNAIGITITAGYGSTADSVPEPITQAVLFLAHSYYDSSAFKDIDDTVANLLKPYMNRTA